MKKILIPVLLFGTIAATSAASINDGHIYIQGEGGYSALDTDHNLNANHGFTYNTRGGSERGYAIRGGYEMPISGPWSLGLEAGYINLGDASYGVNYIIPGEMKYKQHGGDLLATTTYHFNNGMNIFGKAGGAWISQKATLAGISVASKNKILPELAAGIGFDVNKKITLTATVSRIFGDSIIMNAIVPVNAVASSTSVSAGLKFKIT